MAVTSIVLDIKANTDRALNDFKRFSAQLDNKFLISGLKLDVVRNALGQINREFQKAIGEQGLQAGQSLRAAQNQAALLTQTFKGFSSAAALDISTQFSAAFNEVAIKAGGTAQDIQKALAATPFISTNLSEDMRKALGQGVLSFQRDFRRAGLGEDFSGIARQFLMGQLTAEEMINSGDAGQSFLGTQLARSTGTVGLITNAQQRSEALLRIVQDPEFNKQLTDMARRAYGFRAIIEDLNTRLFNPEKGIFGSLRQVTMSVGDKTTIFDETERLINSVFGQQGLFVNFFRQIGKIFGIEDPLKVIITGVRFITRQFEKLNEFVQAPEFQNIVRLIQGAFTRVKNFFTTVYDQIQSGSFEPEPINAQIRSIGEGIRGFFKQVGDAIRGTDISDQADGGASITATILDEIGKTVIAFFREIGGALLEKAGTIALKLVEVIPGTIARLFISLFSEGGIVGQAIGTVIATRFTVGALRAVGSGRQALENIRGGEGGPLGAANRFLNRPFRGPGSARDGELASNLGSTQTFHRQVIFYLSRIANCVCGRGIASPDLDAGRPDTSSGRRRVASLGYSGPRRPAAYSSPIGPLPDVRSSYLASRREATRNILGRGSSSAALERYTESLRGPYSDLDDDRRGLMASEVSEREGQRVADRYNRRFGRRARFMRGMRGFGRGALIAGGITAGLSLLGGGAAQASETEEGQSVGAGQAFGAVGMGAAEGALTGAMFGPWGAAIGGVIGGGIALMDKGVRDAIGKFLSEAGSNLLKTASGLAEGLKKNVLNAFEGIRGFASSIDWKSVLINALVPGGQFTIQGLQSLGEFASKLNVFDGIKTGLDSIANPVKNLWDKISGWNWPWNKREVGGPVIRGTSYIVGERGPEIFTPGQNGTISANRELRSLSSGSSGSISANFNIAVNVNGNMGAGDVESLRGPVLAIIQDAWNEVTSGTVTRGTVV